MAKLTYKEFIKWSYKNADHLSEGDGKFVYSVIKRIQPLGWFGRLRAWARVRFIAEAIMEKYNTAADEPK